MQSFSCSHAYFTLNYYRKRCEAQKQDLEERLEYMTTQFDTLSDSIKNRILKFSEEVEQQVF